MMSPEKADKVTNVSDLIGSWGPLQKKIFGLLAIIYVVAPFNYLGITYYALKDEIWCEQNNGTKIILHSDKCTFDELESCKQWGFETDRITISREWNMICERYWLKSFTLSVYVFGYLISGIVIGYISDKFGRKFALACSVFLEIISQIGIIFTSNLYVFIVLRVIDGIGGYGRYIVALILCMENVGPNHRGKMVISFEWLWYIATYVMIITCYFVLDFRTIFIGITIYQLATLIAIYYLPESPRWQLISGDKTKAGIILRQYSELDEDIFNAKFGQLCENLNELQLKEKENEKFNIFRLFKYKETRKIFLCFLVIWLMRSFVEDGIYYVSFDLSSSVFINNAIFTAFAAATNLYMTYSVDKYRRKVLLIAGLILSSVSLALAIPFANSDKMFPMVLFVALGNCFITSTYSLIYTYTPEVFPTQIRNVAVGICSSVDKVASIFGTFINQVTASYNLKVTLIVLAIPGLIAAGFTTLLNETKGVEIPDTIEEMIQINSKKNKRTNK
ncbi:organic cation transporter protein [Tetranychus urticae]|uniref:organic cation transporter protein n=1 Tax=Tetranychus urticae TaxID=32264 RepID=UPI00077BFD74|nr:organic cation transporter protein [Tetranychus urticae]